MKFTTFIKDIPKSIIDIFLPAYCFNCREPLQENRKIICEKCYLSLPGINKDQLQVFLERIPQKFFDDIYITFQFSELFQQIMYFFKYQGYKEIADYFAGTLKDSVSKEYDMVTFVPLHNTKQRERGFNQSAVIAEKFSLLSGLNFNPDLLQRTRYTVSQTKLKRSRRQQNVHGAFETKVNLENKSVLIIDDVITTGATLNECAKILKENNAKRVDIAAMATPTNLLQNKLELDDSGGLILR